MITYGVSSTEDLKRILHLQQTNLPKAISEEEAAQEGFVTVSHDLPLLARMNAPYPHIVARNGVEIIGYTLVMLPELRQDIPILVPMFDQIEKVSYEGVLLKDCKYVVMGQVCIDKAYRGQGVFAGLYTEMSRRMKAAGFDFIITEISRRNPRSLRAHEKVGFENVLEYQSEDGEEWVIVLLDCNI